MKFTIEWFDDEQFPFFELHMVSRVRAPGIKEAMAKARPPSELDPKTASVAQVKRKFKDTRLAQPVYDAMNGMMFDETVINKARTWREAMRSPVSRPFHPSTNEAQ